MFQRPHPGRRQASPDAGIGMDPYYRFAAAHPMLIRITGGHRVYVTDPITTFYSWTLAFHPQDDADNSKPADMQPNTSAGPKNEDSPTEWPALEASGQDNVPTDGSVVVLAWPSPSQDFLVFHYTPKRYARIDSKKTSGSTTWYEWTEMEPGPRNAGGQTFTVKRGGLTGTEEAGPLLRNPLFELNQREIPVGEIVEFWACPVRVDTGADDGYLKERPEAIISETLAGNGTSQNEQQLVKWYGALGGTYKLRITNSAGAVGISNEIEIGDNSAAVETAIEASGVVTSVSVSGTGEDATVTFLDNFANLPLMEIAESDVWTDTPYFCDYNGGATGFWSRIGCRTQVSGTWEYEHHEVEWATPTQSPPDDKSGGRYGFTRQSALVERTTTGNAGTIEVQRITFCGPPLTSGTWTVSGSDPLAYDINDVDLTAALFDALGVAVEADGNMSDGFTISWPAVGAQTLLTVDVSGLSPAGPTTPAYEVNNQKVKAGTVVWMEWDAANECYRFACPFVACGGVELPGFVAGRKNWVYVDSDGCWKVVPGNTDCA